MNRVEQLKYVQDEALTLFTKKNTDYGDAFATYGLTGVLVRVHDKLQRFMNVTGKGLNLVDDETLRDTLLDLHNYAAMGIMLRGPIKTKNLKVKKLNTEARIPTRCSPGSVGYDIYSLVNISVPPNERILVETGIAITLPPGTYGRVAPRSGIAVRNGIQIGAGVIDPDYTGEVKVLIINSGEFSFVINKGERIAQLIIEKCEILPVEEVDALDTTERGEGGFGSTGSV